MRGTMATPDRAKLAADAARKQQEQRERHDPELRSGHIRQGRERPADEFVCLGVVVRDGQVLQWSATGLRVLRPLAGTQAGIAGPLKTLARAAPSPLP